MYLTEEKPCCLTHYAYSIDDEPKIRQRYLLYTFSEARKVNSIRGEATKVGVKSAQVCSRYTDPGINSDKVPIPLYFVEL
jgi:hypothetical protein